jgi:flap endonuclease-1
MWASEAAKMPILEFSLEKALAGLDLTMDQFVDVCILAGCDYCETIKGIAATTAYKLVKKEGSLAGVLASLDKEKHPVPKDCDYDEVRRLFTAPEVADPASVELKWADPDEAGITRFLVEEKGFSSVRVEAGIAKLKKARTSGAQSRMDSFFKVVPGPAAGGAGGGGAGGGVGVGAKRKGPDPKAAGKGGAAKGGAGGGAGGKAKPAAGSAAKKPATGK